MKKVRAIKKQLPVSETDYLLSTEANRKHLMRSIDQANKGNVRVIKTDDLWKEEQELTSDEKRQDIVAFLLTAPVFTKKQLDTISKTRRTINQWRVKQ